MLVSAFTGSSIVLCYFIYKFHKKTKVKESVKTQESRESTADNSAKSHVHKAIDEFVKAFPDGISNNDIIMKGEKIGQFLDIDIHDHLVLSNGWCLDWHDVVRTDKKGNIIPPAPCSKSLIIAIDNLMYKLRFDDTDNIFKAI
jgi:hypothetical protein